MIRFACSSHSRVCSAHRLEELPGSYRGRPPHRVHGRVSHHRLPYGQSSYLSTSTEEVDKGTAREEADHRPCYGIENYARVLPRPAGGSRVLSGNRRSGQDKPVQGSGVGLLATPFTYIEAAVPWGAKQ